MWKVTPLDFNPYNAFRMTFTPPASDLNSCPAIVYILSRQSAVEYAFWMSHVSNSRSLRDAIKRATLTKSLKPTKKYVSGAGASVSFPLATYLAFHLKFLPNLMSNIK
jgi:hypothetical protein